MSDKIQISYQLPLISHIIMLFVTPTLFRFFNLKQLLAPRRQCCDILPPTQRNVMELAIRECKVEELIYMHP